MRNSVVGFLSVLVLPSAAMAQAAPNTNSGGVAGSVTVTAPVPSTPVQGPTAIAPVQVPTVACPPAAETMYTEGMNRMSAGDDAGANNMFGRVLELCPNHPTARDMQRVAQSHMTPGSTGTNSSNAVVPVAVVPNTGVPVNGQLGVLAGGRDFIPTENALYGPENLSWGARISFVSAATIHGMIFGSFLPTAFTNNVPWQAPMAGVLLGGAIGATTSIVLSMDGVTSGQALSMSLIPVIGEMAGLSAAFLVNANNFQLVGGLVTLGTALGIGGAIGLAYTKPLAGKVNLAASSSLWGLMVGSHLALSIAAGGTQISLPLLGGMMLGGLGGGGLLGGLLSMNTRISSERMWYIDASMAGGWAVFGLSSLLIGSSTSGGGGSGTLVAYGIGSIAGVALGALFGVLVTRNTDRYWEEVHPAQMQQRELERTQPARPVAQRPTFNFSPGMAAMTPGSTTFPMTLNVSGTF